MQAAESWTRRIGVVVSGGLLVSAVLWLPEQATAQTGGLELVREAKPFVVSLTRGEPAIVSILLKNIGPTPIDIDKIEFEFGGASKEPASTPRPSVAYPAGVPIPEDQTVTVGLLFPAFPPGRNYTGDLYLVRKDPTQAPQLITSFPISVQEPQGAKLPPRSSGWISALLAAIVIIAPFGVRGPGRRNFFQSPEGTYSISRFQVWLWTAAILFSYAFLFFTTGPNVTIPDTVLGMMGLSVGSITAATSIAKPRGRRSSAAPPAQSWLSSMLSERGEPSAMRLQVFAWTIAVLLFFIWRVATTGTLWDIPTSVLVLMGVSHGGYLIDKATQRPPEKSPSATHQ